MAGGGESAEERERREGRGRLSSIDLLPEEAEPDIVWANEQLTGRSMPQNAILDEFNKRLADRGIGAISKSAWSRYSVRKAIQFRRHAQARKMSAELVSQLGPDGADDVTVMVAELLKVAMLELLEGGDLKSNTVMELARGLQSVVGAQKSSVEHRQKLEREKREQEQKVENAFDQAERIVSEAGLSSDRIAQLRREFLGVGR